MNVHGGYYCLVVVTPYPQIFNRSHDNLSDCFHTFLHIEGGGGAIYETFVVIFCTSYKFIYSVMRSYCPENLVTLGLA